MSQTFFGIPSVPITALEATGPAPRVAVLGAPMAELYPGRPPHAADAPSALRAASARLVPFIGHHNFDTGAPFAPWTSSAADVGDIAVDPTDGRGNRTRITQAVRAVRANGWIPLLLGGDDAVAIPFVAAFEDAERVTVLQLDAHLDYRNEVDGVRNGYSSVMRRAAEMPWVRRIVHVGLRGVGSARTEDVAASIAAGNEIHAARELRAAGHARVLDRIGADDPIVVVLDCDVIDPPEMPAVRAPVPSGVRLACVASLVAAAASNNRLLGLAVTEFVPELDVAGRGSTGLVYLLDRILGFSSSNPSEHRLASCI